MGQNRSEAREQGVCLEPFPHHLPFSPGTACLRAELSPLRCALSPPSPQRCLFSSPLTPRGPLSFPAPLRPTLRALRIRAGCKARAVASLRLTQLRPCPRGHEHLPGRELPEPDTHPPAAPSAVPEASPLESPAQGLASAEPEASSRWRNARLGHRRL